MTARKYTAPGTRNWSAVDELAWSGRATVGDLAQGAASVGLRLAHLGTGTLSLHNYRGNVTAMPLARSRVTAQGQISVPAEIRRKLGVGPGSILEWNEEGDAVVVRRSGRFSSVEIHRAIFGHENPTPRGLSELKDGIRRHVRGRHARG